MPWTETSHVVTDEGVEFEFHAGADKNGLPMFGQRVVIDPDAVAPTKRPDPPQGVLQAARAAALADLPTVDVAPAGRLTAASRAIAAKAPVLAAHPKATTGTLAAAVAGVAVHFVPLLF